MTIFTLKNTIIDYIKSNNLKNCLFLDCFVSRIVSKSFSEVTVLDKTSSFYKKKYDFLLIYSKNIYIDFFIKKLDSNNLLEKILLNYFNRIIIFYNNFIIPKYIDIPVKFLTNFMLLNSFKLFKCSNISLLKNTNGSYFLRVPFSKYKCLFYSIRNLVNVSINGLFYIKKSIKRVLVSNDFILSN